MNFFGQLLSRPRRKIRFALFASSISLQTQLALSTDRVSALNRRAKMNGSFC